ncbi:MAG: hypothetical protein H6587_07085 [Flavobacteriales bacterium]|nr:hypothetical protein [Flavobacteriales bacterium]
MRLIILSLAVLLFACKQEEARTKIQEQEMKNTDVKTTFDSIKAEEYGADDYGMKSYVMAFLKKGPNRDLDSTEAEKLQRAHLDNIGKMAEAGKLVLAGPFFGDGDLRGIYIFDVETIEEAQQLTESDPAIQAGSLVMELKQWYGSAALLEVGKVHPTIAKKEI